MGNGDGSFKDGTGYVSHDTPVAVAVGNLLGNNKMDVAVADQGPHDVRVFQGTGEGTLQEAAVYPGAGRTPQDIIARDFTGDGQLDLAIADSGGPALTIMRNISSSAVYFDITALASPRAGVSCPFTVTAVNSAGQTVAGYSGTVHFSSNDPAAVLPANVALVNGVATANVTFGAAGNFYLRGTDVANLRITGTSHTLTVTGVPLDHFRVTSNTTTSTAGDSVTITVTAMTASNQSLTGYTGTVHFASTDAQAVLPADYSFVAADQGVHSFAVILKTAGSQSVTASDVSNTSKNGSALITVDAAI